MEENLNQPGVLIPVLCHAAAPVLLIMLQGDHGSAIVFLFIACGMLFSAGLAWKYILTAGGLTIAGVNVLDRAGLSGLLVDAVLAADERGREMEKE